MIPSAVAAPTPLRASPAIVSYALPMIGISSAVPVIAAAGIAMLISKESISPFTTTHPLLERPDIDSPLPKLTPTPFDFAAQIEQLRRLVPLAHPFADQGHALFRGNLSFFHDRQTLGCCR